MRIAYSCSGKQTAVVRASDDFYPRDPASHTIHVSSVAYNTLFLGEFMQPDWDMFHVSFSYLSIFNNFKESNRLVRLMYQLWSKSGFHQTTP